HIRLTTRPSPFPYTTLFRSPANVSQFWNPSPEQIQKLELLLPKYVRYGAGRKPGIPDDVEYHRQYVGIVVNGKRLIYGNFYPVRDRKSTRLNSSHGSISYAV